MENITSSRSVITRDHEGSYTRFETIYASSGSLVSGKLSDIFSKHRIVRDKKKDLAALTPGIFSDRVGRTNENVIGFSNLVFLDFDKLTKESFEYLTNITSSAAYVLYTTYRHDPTTHYRLRIIFILDQSPTIEDHPYILKILLRETGCLADTSCLNLSSCFLEPGTSSELAPYANIKFNDGYLLSLDKLKEEINVLKKELQKLKGKISRPLRSYKYEINKELQPYEAFVNILNCCPALMKLARKAIREQLSFQEGFAILSYLQLFQEAVERFSKRSIGWGKTARDQKEIENFINKSLPPYSCSTLQRYGICHFTTPDHCMEPINGREPSPIRFSKHPINPKLRLETFLNQGDTNESDEKKS